MTCPAVEPMHLFGPERSKQAHAAGAESIEVRAFVPWLRSVPVVRLVSCLPPRVREICGLLTAQLIRNNVRSLREGSGPMLCKVISSDIN